MFGHGNQRLLLRLFNFLIIYNQVVIGSTNMPINREIPFRPPTHGEIMIALEMADSKRNRFGVTSFSNHLHQVVSILVSIITGGTIEPRHKERDYDVLHDSIYFEIASNRDRIDILPKDVPTIVLDKYLLARAWGLPEDLLKFSKLEESRKHDISSLIPDDPKEGIFKSPDYLKDTDFLDHISPLWSDIMLRKMSEEVKVDDFSSFKPKPLNTKQQFSTYISKIPMTHLMIDEEAAESISMSNISWLASKPDPFVPFDLNNMKPNIAASCKNGIWTLADDEGDRIDVSGSKRYTTTLDKEYMVISKEYIDDIKSYALKRNKMFADIMYKNYGSNLLEISEPPLPFYTGYEWVPAQIMSRPLPTDSNLWDMLIKAMPDQCRQTIDEAHKSLSVSSIFHEALFMREVCTSIILHKRNTKRCRLLVKHKFLSLCAAVSIVGDISSNNADGGFAHVRFHMNFDGIKINSMPGYRISSSPTLGGEYRYISQGFKLRKPDIAWYISLPEKMINLVYSTYEELGNKPRDSQTQENFKQMRVRCSQLMLCNLSIMARSSWGYSRVLKPFKYFVINISQRSNFCFQTEDKMWDEIKQYGGIAKFPELYMFLMNLNNNVKNKSISDDVSPCFRIPIEMMGHEAFIMNLCPKQLYGRKRHSIAVFEKICEETDLYFDNLDIILQIRDDAQRIYSNHKSGLIADIHIIYEHIMLVESLSATTGIRFIYTPLSQCMIYQQLKDELLSGMSTYGGNIHHPEFSELLTTKGSFSTHMNKNCKALEGMTLLAKEVSSEYPITTLNSAVYILSKMIRDPNSIPLLYAIVPKDQVGGDREISMMNEYFRVLQSICESTARHYGSLTGVDKLSDPNKDSEFYKLVMMDGPMFAFIGDQTRWGPNFNTIVFGDMFLLMKMAGFAHTSIAHMVCYLAQRKIFLCPENVDFNMSKAKYRSKDLRYSGVAAPSHMGEGIFHYSSSLYHSLVSKRFCSLISKLPGLSKFTTHILVTSDDISYINKNIIESDIPILRNCYKGFQKFLTPMSIKTSNYKNMESETYAEFNSIAIFPRMRKYLFQTLKQTVGNVMIPTSHTFWNDQTAAISSFNTILNSGGSFTMAYMTYLLNTTLAFRRWSMLRLFYLGGYFRVMTPKQLIQNESPFPREYNLSTENGQINVVKSSDSQAVFKFRTLERFMSCWSTLKDMSKHLDLYSEMRSTSLKVAPESNSTPLSRFILPSSFKTRATVPIKLVPSAFHELKDMCIPDAPISIELAAVLSSQSWFKNKDEYHNLEILLPKYEEDISDEDYLSNIMSHLTMSLRTDTDITPVIPKNDELTPAIHKLRANVMPLLNAESIIVQNFGSYYEGEAGLIHQRIIRLDGRGIDLADKLKASITRYFNTYQDIFTFVSSLVRLIDDALKKSALRITGLYTQDKNVLLANYTRNINTYHRIVKTSLTIPMSYIFKDPVFQFNINKMTSGVPCNGEKLYLLDRENNFFESNIPNFQMAQDAGDRYVKHMSQGDVFYKKPGNSSYLPLSILTNYGDPMAVSREDLRIVIVESGSFFTETVIHAAEKEFDFEAKSIDDIFSMMSDGTLDTESIQSFAVDNILDSSQRRIEVEEMKGEESEEMEDPFMMFSDPKNQIHDVTIESRAVEITDPHIKTLIIACRDGYFLKHCMANWLNDSEGTLYERHPIEGMKGQFKVFQSKAVALCYAKVNARFGQVKHPNELRVLASQIFESPPIIKSKFTREGDTLFISASILKLAQLSLEMYRSKNWAVSSTYTMPLLIISSLFGQ